jgi:hypothetical protein
MGPVEGGVTQAASRAAAAAAVRVSAAARNEMCMVCLLLSRLVDGWCAAFLVWHGGAALALCPGIRHLFAYVKMPGIFD